MARSSKETRGRKALSPEQKLKGKVLLLKPAEWVAVAAAAAAVNESVNGYIRGLVVKALKRQGVEV